MVTDSEHITVLGMFYTRQLWTILEDVFIFGSGTCHFVLLVLWCCSEINTAYKLLFVLVFIKVYIQSIKIIPLCCG